MDLISVSLCPSEPISYEPHVKYEVILEELG